MPKVGEGWVEITTRVLKKDLAETRKTIEKGLEGISAKVDVDTTAASINRLRRKIQAGLASINVQVTPDVSAASVRRARRAIESALGSISVTVSIDVDAASLARARAQIASALAGLNTTVRVNTRQTNTTRSTFDRGANLFAMAGGPIRNFLWQISNLFQLQGPVGGAIILGLIGAVAAAAVPAGAMFGGLFAAALGSMPAVAAAFIGIWENPEVENALEALGDKFLTTIVEPLREPFGKSILFILEEADRLLEKLTPNIKSILEAGNRFLQPLAAGLLISFDIGIPAFDQFVNSDFMTQIMNEFGYGWVKIADSIAQGWADILADPQAQAGMVRGLNDIFDVLAWAIDTSFDFIRWLSRSWESVNTPGKDGRTQFDKIKEILGNVWTAIVDIFMGAKELFKGISLDDLIGVSELIGKAAEIVRKILEFIAPFVNFEAGALGGEEGGSGIGDDAYRKLPPWFHNPFTNSEDGGFAFPWEDDWANPFDFLFGGGGASGVKLPDIGAIIQTALAGVPGVIGSVAGGSPLGILNGLFGQQGLTGAITSITSQFGMLFPQLTSTGLTGLLSFQTGSGWSGLPGWFSSVVTGPISGLWGGLFGGFAGRAGAAFNGVAATIAARINAIIAMLRDAIFNKIPRLASSVGGGIGGMISSGISAIGGLFMADGGSVSGPGSGTSDSIPAMLSNGEYVVNARSASQNAGLLDAINSGSGYSPVINVYVDGVQVAHRQTVENSLNSLVASLRAGRGE